MNESLPRGFVESERRRVFTPDESFARRVIARVRPVGQSATAVWELIPGFARPMILAMAGILVLIVGFQISYTDLPETGIVDATLEAEHTAADELIYHDFELPQGDALLLEISQASDSR